MRTCSTTRTCNARQRFLRNIQILFDYLVVIIDLSSVEVTSKIAYSDHPKEFLLRLEHNTSKIEGKHHRIYIFLMSIFLFHPWWIEDVNLQSVTHNIIEAPEERRLRWDISDEIDSLVAYVNPSMSVNLRHSFHPPKIEQVGMVCDASKRTINGSWLKTTGESGIRIVIDSCKGSCHNNSEDVVILVGDPPTSIFNSNVGNCLLGNIGM